MIIKREVGEGKDDSMVIKRKVRGRMAEDIKIERKTLNSKKAIY